MDTFLITYLFVGLLAAALLYIAVRGGAEKESS